MSDFVLVLKPVESIVTFSSFRFCLFLLSDVTYDFQNSKNSNVEMHFFISFVKEDFCTKSTYTFVIRLLFERLKNKINSFWITLESVVINYN